MKLLAIDTALSACAAAVLTSENDSENVTFHSEDLGRGHAEHIMGMVAAVMAEASTPFTALDRVVVNVGPGSFTGLRVGLSIARGFGLVLEKPVLGVTTLQAIAHEARHAEFCEKPLLVAMDAKRNEIFCQLFDEYGNECSQPFVSNYDDIKEHLTNGIAVAGTAAQEIVALASDEQKIVALQITKASIEHIAKLGASAPIKQEAPKPLYLRAPDAVPGQKGKVQRL
ncbi:tRNA (adenosine(37)-N6)-threonylcarbamoyltransferase complex dimerization subunit type 1 TsaB [Polycladidibacter stylochi]|uniref:tRNA (adenosine(37)-N6)-threonylcarbamoyltransferase complex dimerization subunit type 1 TsaB n=1 Tax=Polycladidibacter stylochi TaxID=1807766 RepID=UPI000831AA26|nr:tRNA (adenosine(37)-N6)-threonylcarbamoyltransferase complex dimerization subunit type 1 TsaB [Pseudovibrio stylochi]